MPPTEANAAARHRLRFGERVDTERLTPAAAVLIVIAIVTAAAYVFAESRLRHKTEEGNARIIAAERLLSGLKDIETGERGFVITGDPAYLQPYEAGQTRADASLAALQPGAEALGQLVASKRAEAARIVDMRRQDGNAAARAQVLAGEDKASMDRVRVAVADMQARTQARLARAGVVEARSGAALLSVALVSLLAGLAVVAIVVSRRRRSERESRTLLASSEERFRTLVESNAAIVWVAPPTGQFAGPQPAWARFIGESETALSGSAWMRFVHPEDRAEAAHIWSEGIASEAPFTTEHRLRRADGEWRDMWVRAVPVLDADGKVGEWVGTHSDITERRQAQAELIAAKETAEAANRAKSQFLANMSHELRTPLSAVIGYSEMLEEEMADGGHTALLADVRKIKSNARHLLSLINDVLDLSKIEAERMTVFAEDFPTAPLLHDVAATVQALIAKKKNTLELDLGDEADLGSMHSDQVKLRQCLFNLISNAAKFTSSGRIVLRARRDGDMLDISVADDGIGMSAGQLDRLFERFAQADASTTRRFGGTGLGLAITRAFSRLLGGDVTVQSTEGAGSVFTMRIPATLPEQTEQAELEESADAAAGAAPVAAERHVVLVVDDDRNQRDLLTRFLERQGFAVRTAADGRAGLDLAQKLRPHAILLDVMMPQMDGWSVLTALKADPDVCHIPVILVTFVNDPALGSSLGAAELVPKPVDWDRLSKVMERFQGEGNVLVVDDDPDARDRLRTVLERNGWSVAEAANGKEALEQVAAAVPRVILLDLTMPVMDGFTFLHALREKPEWSDIPVAVLTARDLSEGDRARLDGASRVLAKGSTSLRDLAGEVLALARQVGK